MRLPRPTRPLIVGAGLFAVGLAVGATLASYLPDAVTSLTYATPDGMTTAQRCSASANMNGHLNGLTELSARRSLSPERREQEFPVQLGVIGVRDTAIGEPFGPVLAFTNKRRTAVAVVVDGRAAEVTLRTADLDWLKTICSGSSR